jgi:hypothetical protein
MNSISEFANYKPLNLKLDDLKSGQYYFLVSETKSRAKFRMGKLLFAEDGMLTFNVKTREYLRIQSADYNLLETSNGNRSCIFKSMYDAEDYLNYLMLLAQCNTITIK